MAVAYPAPALRPEPEIGALVTELIAENDPSRYSMSKIQALTWVLGTARLSPGAHTAWHVKPTPAQVDAEHHLVTGRFYGENNRDLYAGADEAL
jgi:hypothetical protein